MVCMPREGFLSLYAPEKSMAIEYIKPRELGLCLASSHRWAAEVCVS